MIVREQSCDQLPTKLSTIQCGHFPACSGCEFQKNVLSPPIWQELQEIFGPFPLHIGKITQWRMRAKLAIRGTSRNPQIGLFQRGTHNVQDIPDCPLHHPSINQAIAILRQKIQNEKIPVYDELTGKGILRYVQLVVDRKTEQVQLTLVSTKEWKPIFTEKIWHSIWLNIQPERTNRIFGDRWIHCQGEPFLWDQIGKISFPFHPASFGQAHLSLFEKMIQSIDRMVVPNKKVIECYAGIGVIGLSIAEKCQSCLLTEINPFSKICFDETIKNLSLPISFTTVSAEEIDLHSADVVIVDPPRKGLSENLIKNLSSQEQLIYISCNPLSFKRDHERLIQSGWTLKEIEGYLLFPGTNQIELLADFRK